jgi:hypothetical protein
MKAWAANEWEIVGRYGLQNDRSTIALACARGETIGFQIVVGGPAAQVDLELPTGGGDVTFRAGREHYARTPELPDGLRPVKPLDVPAEANQPYWIDVTVWADATSTGGVYHLGIRERGVVVKSIELNLTIWNFPLPPTATLPNQVLLWGPERHDIVAADLMLAHRIQPMFVPAEGAEEYVALGQTVGNPGGLWCGLTSSGAYVNPPPTPEEVEERATHYPDALRLIGFIQDEPAESLNERLEHWAQAVTDNPRVDTLVTHEPHPDWKWPKIMCELPKLDVKEHREEALLRGQEVWAYTTVKQDDFSPHWLIGEGASPFLVWAWCLWAMRISGWLYWRSNYWGENPWHYPTPPNPDWPRYYGEGQLFYPAHRGDPEGFYPSLRLKWLRSTQNLHDYLWMLRQKGHGAWADGKCFTVAQDWRTWSRSPSFMHKVRLELGKRLHDLATPPPARKRTVVRVRQPGAEPFEQVVTPELPLSVDVTIEEGRDG